MRSRDVVLHLDEGLQSFYFNATYIRFATTSERTILWHCVLWGLSTHPRCTLFILPLHVSNTLEHLIHMHTLKHFCVCQVMLKHIQLHEYDLTDKGISQACYDELVAELGDAWVHLTEQQLRVLADHEREKFKDWMRPLFA